MEKKKSNDLKVHEYPNVGITKVLLQYAGRCTGHGKWVVKSNTILDTVMLVIFIIMWIPFFWLLFPYNQCSVEFFILFFFNSCCRLVTYLRCFTNTMKVLILQRLIIILYPSIRLDLRFLR